MVVRWRDEPRSSISQFRNSFPRTAFTHARTLGTINVRVTLMACNVFLTHVKFGTSGLPCPALFASHCMRELFWRFVINTISDTSVIITRRDEKFNSQIRIPSSKECCYTSVNQLWNDLVVLITLRNSSRAAEPIDLIFSQQISVPSTQPWF